jgi:hypothetical protein
MIKIYLFEVCHLVNGAVPPCLARRGRLPVRLTFSGFILLGPVPNRRL